MLPGIAGIAGMNHGAAVSPTGALVYNVTGSPSTAPVTWDSETYDVGGWHSTSSNTERLTVPSGVSLVRAVSCADGANSNIVRIEKNGASFRGTGWKSNDTAGDNAVTAATAIIAVSPGDYFSVNSARTNIPASSWFSIEAVDSATKYALVNKTGNQSISAGVTTTLTWDAEVADTDSFHDNVTNNSRLTVPSGVTLVRVGAQFDGSNLAQAVISFLKGGASVRGLPAYDTDVSGSDLVQAWSAPLVVSSGQYFEARAFATNAITIGSGNENWFSIEEVPSTYKRALVYKTGNQSISNNTVTTLTWDAEEYDTDGLHDTVTNNSRLTVPSGVTQALITFGVRTPSATGQHGATVRMNGSTTGGPAFPAAETDTAGTDSLNAMGGWIPVSPGDYFELRYFQASGGSINIGTDDETWFSMVCR